MLPGGLARRARLGHACRVLPEEALRIRLRRALMDRGRVLATLLAQVLAGKSVEAKLGALGIEGKPGMRPAEKLRHALEQIEVRRVMLDSRDERFGRCDICATDLSELELTELPWADRCRAHAG